eukprot:644954-Prymnesium_polylepis.1
MLLSTVADTALRCRPFPLTAHRSHYSQRTPRVSRIRYHPALFSPPVRAALHGAGAGGHLGRRGSHPLGEGLVQPQLSRRVAILRI